MREENQMKKSASILITILLVGTMFVGLFGITDLFVEEAKAAGGSFGGGNGTAGNPYMIEDVNDLQNMSADLDSHYMLVNNIDATITSTWNSESGFQPVGNDPASFNGTFNGNGHVIFNLTINRLAEDYVGLFGYLSGSATISNLGLDNVNITGNNYVGSLAGMNSGTITNCYGTGNTSRSWYVGIFAGMNSGTITNCYSTGDTIGDYYVGGFTGMNSGTIINCYSTGNACGLYAGGFVGRNNENITNCYSTGNANGHNYGGGFVGDNFAGSITNCYSTGAANGNYYNGGFVGNNAGTLSDCYSTGNTNGHNYAGGFVGRNNENITNCYSTGNTSGNDRIGGFIGYKSSGTVMNCYSIGNASGISNVGGFAGSIETVISNCYSIGNASGISNIGGFVGNNAATLMNCFWDMESSGNPTSNGGTGNTTAEMKQQATFTGWDFKNTWGIIEDMTYPFFTTLTIIITTRQVTIIHTGIEEDSRYMVDFDATAQPLPYFNKMENWTCDSNASWLSLNSTTGVLSGTPDNGDVGIYYAHILITDTLGSASFYNFTLEVTNVNPIITTADITVAVAGALYNKDYNSTDDDQGIVTWHMETNITWPIFLNSATGLLLGLSSSSDVGSYWLNVSVDDGNGGIDWSNFTLEVKIDSDHDGIPDDTDIDDDNDGTPDTSDAFPLDPAEDTDTDSDGIGNNADTDDDGDGWNDFLEITLGTDPLDSSSVPPDMDGDGIADPLDNDMDGDGYSNFNDLFPEDSTEWNDTDGDGIGDNSDAFPMDFDNDGYDDYDDAFPTDPSEWNDTDKDGIGDNSDSDLDGDGVNNTSDAFPYKSGEWADTDEDGIGNNADADDDNDTWNDSVEILAGTDPLDNSSVPSDADSDGIADFMDPDFLTNIEYSNNTVYVTTDISDTDSDSDGWNDSVELLAGTDPLDSSSMPLDSDGDGIADFMDPDEKQQEGKIIETPMWAYVMIAVAILGFLLAFTIFMLSGKRERHHKEKGFEKSVWEEE